jgi:aspartate dehydrogenase
MSSPPPLDITLLGRGRIAQAVAEGLRDLPGFRLAAMIGRGSAQGPRTPLTIDAAGPAALRDHGAAALRHGDLWTVGAAALLDESLRTSLIAAARTHGHRMRLFTGWIAGPSLCPPDLPARLSISQAAPGLADRPGVFYRGPLEEAGRLFPDHLNTATAAALCGPGIAATRITLRSSPEGGPHRIRARLTLPGQTITSEVRFDQTGPHPVATAILAALARRDAPFHMG